MAIELDHTIVASRDRRAAAQFVADVLGRPAPTSFGPFAVVELDNGVSLRGRYFSSPDGHNLEVITRPYGSGG